MLLSPLKILTHAIILFPGFMRPLACLHRSLARQVLCVLLWSDGQLCLLEMLRIRLGYHHIGAARVDNLFSLRVMGGHPLRLIYPFIPPRLVKWYGGNLIQYRDRSIKYIYIHQIRIVPPILYSPLIHLST